MTNRQPIQPVEGSLTGTDLTATINDRIRRINKAFAEPPIIRSAPPSPSSSATWIDEIPMGVMNGTNLVFTLSFAPIFGSLTLFLNIVQSSHFDFTIAGVTITYTVAPKARDANYHVARYQY